nr:putative mannosyl-oligosaccharide alpha-1,2-mannosidase [Quercus suber]
MLLSTRRLASYLALTAAIIYLFRHLQQSGTYRLPSPQGGKFNWADLPVRYPVEKLIALPKPSGGRLPKVQHDFAKESDDSKRQRLQRRSEVKAAMERTWKSYRKYAWMQDELTPISAGGKSPYGGWSATLVDSLDTLWIMDLRDEFKEAVDAAVHIDFSTTTQETINVFETTIRYLGGFLSAYDLSGDRRLLAKSLELADMLYSAFDTPNRIPNTRWDFHSAAAGNRQEANDGILSAELGTLSLEFTRLSQVTRDDKWYDVAARVMDVFYQQQNSTNLPGMWPLMLNGRDGDFKTGKTFTLGAMSDSLYEYLPKMYALLGGSEMYAEMYNAAMDASTRHAMYRPMLPDNADVLFSGPVEAEAPGEIQDVFPGGQHLVCFAGGMFALGGRLLQNTSHITTGRKLTDGCIWAYEHSKIGIMPEIFSTVPCASQTRCEWDQKKWHDAILARHGDDGKHGVEWVIKDKRLLPGFLSNDDTRYHLRPDGPVEAEAPGEIQDVFPGGQHLVCFAGGMFALGGRLLQNTSHITTGRKLTDGCIWAYEHSKIGIMPEIFSTVPCASQTRCEWDQKKWHDAILARHGDDGKHGVEWVIKDKRLLPGFLSNDDTRYHLRPEAIESVFILYRITGETKYLEKAWNMFQSIMKHTLTEIANAAIEDVTDPAAPKKDTMESFWTAETLKYFYLIFSEPSLISLDEYVLNTEAHPFKIPNYGS